MNAGPRHESAPPVDPNALLLLVRQRFYPPATPASGPRFYRDRRMLLYVLSWPAVWLQQRALTCSPERYRALIAERLDAIAAHGDPTRYGVYFPAYLLKCLQDWFRYHGDELDAELKHIRNALDQVLASVSFAAEVRRDAHHLDVLASAHRLIAGQCSRRVQHDAGQLSLPLQ